jgi:hypothetical protein
MKRSTMLLRLAALGCLSSAAIGDAPIDLAARTAQAEAIRATIMATVLDGKWSRKGIMYDAIGGVTNERDEPLCITPENRQHLIGESWLDGYVVQAGAKACKFELLELNGQNLSLKLACSLTDDPEQIDFTDRLTGTIAPDRIELRAKGEVFGQIGNNYQVTMQRSGSCTQKDVSETQPTIVP